MFLFCFFSSIFSSNVYSSSESDTDKRKSKKTKGEKDKRCVKEEFHRRKQFTCFLLFLLFQGEVFIVLCSTRQVSVSSAVIS